MKISVVMSAYNAEKRIEKAVRSVMESDCDADLELIVVEDCSTDGTMEVLGKLLADYEFTVIPHSQNMGAGWSRRHGIEAATGDYVITIDSDDRIDPDFLQLLAVRAEDTGADIVSGGITIEHADGCRDIKYFPVKESVGMEKFNDYGEGKIIFLNNKLVRRSLMERVPYCTRRFCEDTPVVIPLLYLANKVAYADTAGYHYVQHAGSLCHRVTPFEKNLADALCCMDCRDFFADKEPEYRNLIPFGQFANHVRMMKAAMACGGVPRQHTEDFARVMEYFLNGINL